MSVMKSAMNFLNFQSVNQVDFSLISLDFKLLDNDTLNVLRLEELHRCDMDYDGT